VPHPLDNPVLSSLTGPHSRFAERRGNVLRYPVDVCPFVAMPAEPDGADWTDAAQLAGPGGWLPLAVPRVEPPAGWDVTMFGEGVQMTGDHLEVADDPEAEPLGPADVPEMLELTARTKPGPFLPRTIELGTYLGIRRQGRLVAMAGERLHPAGWTEISAVCTDEAWRGQGLAARLILAVSAGIRARAEIPFLHVLTTNPAIGLYEKLGFGHRRDLLFAAARLPRAPRPEPDRSAEAARPGHGKGGRRGRAGRLTCGRCTARSGATENTWTVTAPGGCWRSWNPFSRPGRRSQRIRGSG
jgi:ribosomal protein S18 acetylase RimI-like enzyme